MLSHNCQPGCMISQDRPVQCEKHALVLNLFSEQKKGIKGKRGRGAQWEVLCGISLYKGFQLLCILSIHLWPSILPTHCYHLWLSLISIYHNVQGEWEAIDVMVSNSWLEGISLSWSRELLTFHDWYTLFPLYFQENLPKWTQFEMLRHAILILQANDFPEEDPEIARMWD